MGRRPLYGGERGIRSREPELIEKLLQTAQADFYHDFGEGVPERDKYTSGDMARFQEIAQGYGIKRVAAIVAGFNSVINKNPFKLLSKTISPEIFPSSGSSSFVDENKALKNLGIDYNTIKQQFLAEINKSKAARTYGSSTLRLPDDITFTIPGGETRTYEVTGVVMKDKSADNERPFNIASRFESVTGGKSNVALVIDASGGLSMTSLQNTDLNPLPQNKMNFYILENIENDSDSATKLKTFDKPKDKSRLEKQPNVVILKDEVDTVLYPKFELAQSNRDGELLFGNADLVLSRVGDEMEADFTFPDNKLYHIENVSQNANVKNASLNILASALASGGKVENGELKVIGDDKTPYLFPYIKRVGDWCQALSLLDGTRKYKGSDGKEYTLDELRQQDTAIGLLTLDRILLGYALTLGIDVFFTTATDLRLLIYFHNKETQLTDEQLIEKIAKLKPDFEKEYAKIGKDNVESILEAGINNVKAATTNTDYIQRLRGTLYRLSLLRTDFAMLTPKIDEIAQKVQTPISPKEKYIAYFEGLTLLRKLNADETHNNLQRTTFATYPAYVEEKSTFDMINSRPQSRAAAAKLQVVLSKDILNDAKQVKKLFEKYDKQKFLGEFLTFEPKEPNAELFRGIFEALSEVRILFGAAQRGGGEKDIEDLKRFLVTPLTDKEYTKKSEETMDVDENPPPEPRVIGSFYRDKKSLPYTVVDQYIITKEDLPIFQRILASGVKPEDAKFVATRLMMVYADMIRGDFEKLMASEDEEYINDDPVPEGVARPTIPSDVKFTNHKRIFYKTSELLDVYFRFLRTDQWANAFQEAFNTFSEADMVDNETVNRLAMGRNGLRKNDYLRTSKKIDLLHMVILNTILGQAKPDGSLLGKRAPDDSIEDERQVRDKTS